MATKSILEIDSISASDMEDGMQLYGDDSYTFISTAGKNPKLRRIMISEFFSKISNFLGNSMFYAGLDYTDVTNPKALDASSGQLITKYADTVSAKALTDAKEYVDSKISESITAALNAKY